MNTTEERILKKLSDQVDEFFRRVGDAPRSEAREPATAAEAYEKTYQLRLAHTNRALGRLYEALERGDD